MQPAARRRVGHLPLRPSSPARAGCCRGNRPDHGRPGLAGVGEGGAQGWKRGCDGTARWHADDPRRPAVRAGGCLRVRHSCREAELRRAGPQLDEPRPWRGRFRPLFLGRRCNPLAARLGARRPAPPWLPCQRSGTRLRAGSRRRGARSWCLAQTDIRGAGWTDAW